MTQSAIGKDLPMRTPTTGMLAVPGASLYYEVRGSGPVLLLISTGNGDAAPFGPLADELADRYLVVSYDRRGFSRSPIDGPVDDGQRLAADADDARRLLNHVGGTPAHVFGTCSGAIVALALIELYPDLIRTLIAHEPPLVSVLPDSARWLKFHDDLYDTYRVSGLEVAREIFREYAGMDGETRPPPWAELPERQLEELLSRLRRNQVFWYEHELRTYPAFVPDIAALKSVSDRLILAGGSTSREHLSCRPTTVLTEQIGTEIMVFPGGHVGHVTHPIEYAGTLARALSASTG
jgi:pimeloyl-ACP methyl ester carboxylesterase